MISRFSEFPFEDRGVQEPVRLTGIGAKMLKQHRLAARYGLREFAELICVKPSEYCHLEHAEWAGIMIENLHVATVLLDLPAQFFEV